VNRATERHLKAAEGDLESDGQRAFPQSIDERSRWRQTEFPASATGSPRRDSEALGAVLRETLGAETISPSHERSLWSKIPPISRLASPLVGDKVNLRGIDRDGFGSAMAEVRGTLPEPSSSGSFRDILGVGGTEEKEVRSQGEDYSEAHSFTMSADRSDEYSAPVASMPSAPAPNIQHQLSVIRRESGSGEGERSHFASVASVNPSSNPEGSFSPRLPSTSSDSVEVPPSAQFVASMDPGLFSAVRSMAAIGISEANVFPMKEPPFLQDSEGLFNSGPDGLGRADALSKLDLNGTGIAAGFSDHAEQSLSLPDPFATLQEGASSFVNRTAALSLGGVNSPGRATQMSVDGGLNPALDLSKTNELLQMLLDEVRKGKEPFLPLVNRDTSFP
jgi:hypothetical protein